MKTIQLTRGHVAIVDAKHFDRLNRFKWSAHLERNGRIYAMRRARLPGGGSRTEYLHQLVLPPKSGFTLDHKGVVNTLDNRERNLRYATASQQCANQRKRRGGTSRFKGVSWSTQKGAWIAQIQVNRKNKYLGAFAGEAEAAEVYRRAAVETFGEFARVDL